MKTSFEIKNDLAELDTLRQQLQLVQHQWSLSDKCLLEINLILDELITNNIEHSDVCDKYLLTITLTKTGRDLTIEVVDAGPPFDPTLITPPDTALPLDQRKCGGLGIFLVRQFCDCWHYARLHNKNVLTLQKTLPKECG